MAPVLHSKAKPKFGHAALLFAGESFEPATPNYIEKLMQTRWLSHALAMAFLFAITGTVIAAQIPDHSPNNLPTTAAQAEAMTNIQVLQSQGENDKLVGTLIHNQEAKARSATFSNEGKAITLTPEERDRLLQIISN